MFKLKSIILLSLLCVLSQLCVIQATWSNIAPVGSPRIVWPDTAYLAKLQASAKQQTNAFMAFKQFVLDGIAGDGKTVFGFGAWHAALLSKVTNTTSYCTSAVKYVDRSVADEEALIAAGNEPNVAYNSYLYVGDVLGDVMIVYDWCRDQTNTSQRSRWANYAHLSVTNLWNCTTAKWGGVDHGWSCWATTSPGNNYYYSFLKATMLTGLALYGEHYGGEMWLNQFRKVKLETELIPYFNSDLYSGGSLEGTGYGVFHKTLFTCYDWWKRSTGEALQSLSPHAYNSFEWMFHNIVPTWDGIANIADHPGAPNSYFYDYHRHYIMALMYLYPSSNFAKVAKTILMKTGSTMVNSFNAWAAFMFDISSFQTLPLNSTYLTTSYRGDGTGIFAVRSSWEINAVYANLICGPLVESHAHLDQGSFLLYHSDYLAADQNYLTNSGIQGGSPYHNMVRLKYGTDYLFQDGSDAICNMTAISDNTLYSYALTSSTQLYKSSEKVSKVEREFLYIKPSTFIVFDRVVIKSGSGVSPILSLNFFGKPTTTSFGITYTNAKSSIAVKTLFPTSPTVSIIDWATVDGDSQSGYRVDYSDSSSSNTTYFLQVFSINSSVSTATALSDSSRLGSLVTLSDGRQATVYFNTKTTGGSIAIVDSSKTTTLVNENFTTKKQNLGVGSPVPIVSSTPYTPAPVVSTTNPTTATSTKKNPTNSTRVSKGISIVHSLGVLCLILSVLSVLF